MHGDEVCIWRNAEVLIKRCHFPCSIINLSIPSADGITAYPQLMWEVVCDQYWECAGIHEFDFRFNQSLAGEFRQVCIADRMAKVMTDITV